MITVARNASLQGYRRRRLNHLFCTTETPSYGMQSVGRELCTAPMKLHKSLASSCGVSLAVKEKVAPLPRTPTTTSPDSILPTRTAYPTKTTAKNGKQLYRSLRKTRFPLTKTQAFTYTVMVKPLPVRSVIDASRFTARSPFAASAATAACIRRRPLQAAFASSSSSSSSTPSSSYSSASSSKNSSNSRFQSPAGSRAPSSQSSSPARRAAIPGGAAGAGAGAGTAAAAAAGPLTGETPAQKVARLRAAHQAAKNAQVSQLDKIISSARRAFDSAHHYTIIGLIGFTGMFSALLFGH